MLIKKVRHYCYRCKKKRIESEMQFVCISNNNKTKWQCNCCKVENRRYGLQANYNR